MNVGRVCVCVSAHVCCLYRIDDEDDEDGGDDDDDDDDDDGDE